MALGRFEEAERLLTGSTRVLLAARGERYATTQAAVNGLVDLYTAWGKPDEAARYRRLLPAISVGAMRDLGPVPFLREYLRSTAASASRSMAAQCGCSGRRPCSSAVSPARGIKNSWGAVEAVTSEGLPAVTGPADGAGAPVNSSRELRTRQTRTGASRPGSVVWDKARGRALVFYSKTRVESREKRRLGTSMAVWPRQDVPACGPWCAPEPRIPRCSSMPASLHWVLERSSSESGCTLRMRPAKGPSGLTCLLARVSLERALERGAWRFYAAAPGGPDWRAATSVIDGASVMSVAWNGYLGKYVAVDTRIISSEILVRTADRPEGPWSGEAIVEGIPSDDVFRWVDSAVAHPELARDGGRVELLTYTPNVSMAGSETRAVEIEFRKRQRE